MTRKIVTYPVSIGNGLFVAVSRREDIFEAYRRIQRICDHAKRDPHGTCYRCGHRQETAPEAI